MLQPPRLRSALALVAVSLMSGACKKEADPAASSTSAGAASPASDTPSPPWAPITTTVDAQGETGSAEPGTVDGGSGPNVPDGDAAAGTSTGTPSTSSSGSTSAADAGEVESAKTPQELLTEIKRKTTPDARAMEALQQAEDAGASARDVAKAANARGLELHGDAARAKAFFEWAAAKDAKYPDPTFNLAKQAAMTGDIPLIKDYLKQTYDRGGKKLLKQIEFDPMWEIVKDDAEVRKLYE